MSGGKGGKQTVGYRYKLAYHAGLGVGPIDAFLEFRGGKKTAWAGRLAHTGIITINQPKLWGGDKDQGGIVSNVQILFGEADQPAPSYVKSVFGEQVPAWRGLSTLVFMGGLYGSMNPYPQAASYKIERITRGWFDGLSECWYPEKAQIQMAGSYTAGPKLFEQKWYYGGGGGLETFGPGAVTAAIPAKSVVRLIEYNDNGAGVNFPRRLVIRDTLKNQIVYDSGWVGDVGWQDALNSLLETMALDHMKGPIEQGTGKTDAVLLSSGVPLGSATYTLYLAVTAQQGDSNIGFVLSSAAVDSRLWAISPAHALYYARTHSLIGREPAESMNDASWRAAADWYYAQGFGVCVEYDPSAESLADYEARLCKLGGCSITRSLTDGQLYIDIANGEYDLAALPILTDDDILDFSEQPTVLDSAVNSLQVKYFDPQKKEDVITPPVQILGLIDAFGTISQTNEYPEIPTGDLGLRVAERDVRAAGTPTRAFDLVCTRKPRDWRPNTYFRLQAPKRGIADMVCIVGTNESGTLKSGAIKMTATQDIYSLSSSTFVEQEPGVDTRPSQTPVAITAQAAFEAPYIDIVASLSRADLAALPDDAGFLEAVAADPATSRNYTLGVQDAGSTWDTSTTGDWCPTCLVVEDADYTDTTFTFAGATGLDTVSTGAAALWGDEIVRIDALDLTAGTLTLARGCADTVPAQHAAGSRLWIWQEHAALGPSQYTDGETLSVKLLTNTGSEQLALSAATAITVELASRAARPYPPGNLQIAGSAYPSSVTGEYAVSWAHRNREAQADQLIDTTAASVTPDETRNLRYALRLLDGSGTVLIERDDIGSTTATVVLNYTGNVMLELYAIDDGGESWQRHVHTFAYTAQSPAPAASTITAPAYTPYVPTWVIDGNGA